MRLEHSVKVNDLSNPYQPITFYNLSDILQRDEQRYTETTRLTQLYFYLTSYMGTSIPDAAFQNMQKVFDNVKKSGYKVILIFAYRYDETCAFETYGDIKRHLSQLKPFLLKNESLIFSVQAGFLGLWGEWHATGLDNSPYHKKVVIRDLLNAIPPGRKLQVRETQYKADAAGYIKRTAGGPIEYYPLTNEEYNRIGFQNAYLVLEQGPYAQWDYRWPDDDYFFVKKECLATVVDGEMPYDGAGAYNFNDIAHGTLGGWKAIERMREHAYSSFSVVHNFKVNISAWKHQLVTPDMFYSHDLAISEDYFLDQHARIIPRPAYEYIRDHLGYRFEMKEAHIPVYVNRGDSATFTIDLKNFGFAPLINKRPVYLVLIDEQGNVTEFRTTVDPRQWMPVQSRSDASQTIKHTERVTEALSPGIYKVGLWLPDEDPELRYNNEYAIQFANGNIEYWKDAAGKFLINVIGSFKIN